MIDVLRRGELVQMLVPQHDAINVSSGTSDAGVVSSTFVHSSRSQVATGATGHWQVESDYQVHSHNAQHNQPLGQQKDDVVQGAFHAALGSNTRRSDKEDKHTADNKVSDTESLQDPKDAQVFQVRASCRVQEDSDKEESY